MSQSINLAAIKNANFNGSAIKKINLNGQEIWTGASFPEVDASWTLLHDWSVYTSWKEAALALGPSVGATINNGSYTIDANGCLTATQTNIEAFLYIPLDGTPLYGRDDGSTINLSEGLVSWSNAGLLTEHLLIGAADENNVGGFWFTKSWIDLLFTNDSGDYYLLDGGTFDTYGYPKVIWQEEDMYGNQSLPGAFVRERINNLIDIKSKASQALKWKIYYR